MTQRIEKENFERIGFRKTINIPSIPAGDFVQFRREHPEIINYIGIYGHFNSFYVVNRSMQDIAVELDMKDISPYVVLSRNYREQSEINYQEFNIRNLGTAAIPANMIHFTIGFEAPIDRERHRLK